MGYQEIPDASQLRSMIDAKKKCHENKLWDDISKVLRQSDHLQTDIKMRHDVPEDLLLAVIEGLKKKGYTASFTKNDSQIDQSAWIELHIDAAIQT